MFFSKQAVTHDETTVHARAKINLTLDVTGTRPDGYHTVKMIMQTVALHDDVTVTVTHGEKKPQGVRLTCNLPYLPTDSRNLAFRAAELFYEETGALLETVDIHIEKRIPVAAGLAGGSTDAAAVLRALSALHAVGLTDGELCEMGLKLGADVPYCLRGGTMLAEGIGETLSPLPDMPHCHVVLCKPPFGISTKEAYRQIDAVELKKRPDTDGMVKALQKGDLAGVCKRLSNVMEDVTASKRRQIGEIKAFLTENGADGTLMSGSGPTVFGLFSDESRARTAAKMLQHRFTDTFLTEIV
ncbi:4-(cytidine 5'-diphospho)-2-C-methyl-D-erythritol kinase [Agathobaculum sp.]|uniref:4-(cytidine 5'-diphospho)-2-C-methyl-D-erythritol kinase n=1 Tax=Agathobaculum sp. TaxID=2048138 RepID=UPI002A815A6C|nr:4-(cytidine 5'-diphospho)-2-C-methyl-D-erythritol kinase [Agathobaculum sp.]MDY3618285.1 4-(cytidine 5'-diphospho)-2-C-methyl-D-erythritol kinase [Agathobaculum sp.]